MLGLGFSNVMMAQEDGYWQQAAEQQKQMQEQERLAWERQQQENMPETSGNKGGGNAPNNSGGGGNKRAAPKVVDMYGAVAFDESRSSFGHAVNKASKSDAENTAISDCGGQSCRIMATYKNSCAAFAGGYKTAGGTYAVYKWHLNSVQKAEGLALSACSKKAKNCQILVSECSVVGK